MQILRRYYERARNSLQEPNTDAAHRLDRVYSENILRIMPQLDEIVEGAKQIKDILKARVSVSTIRKWVKYRIQMKISDYLQI